MYIMDDDQEEHLEFILDEVEDLLEDKYRKGAKEHKSKLHKDYSVEQLVDEAINEAIDQITYLLTLKQKLEEQEAPKSDGNSTQSPRPDDRPYLAG